MPCIILIMNFKNTLNNCCRSDYQSSVISIQYVITRGMSDMSQSPRRQAPEVFLSNKQHLEEQLLHNYNCPHHFAFMEQDVA